MRSSDCVAKQGLCCEAVILLRSGPAFGRNGR